MPSGPPSESPPASLGKLTPMLERQARLAGVPPHLAAAVARLPRTLELTATLPRDAADLPTTARQWLKLALRGDGVRLVDVREGPLEIALSLGAKRRALTPMELDADLRAGLAALLIELYAPAEVAALLEELAFTSSSLATLRRVTSRMLATSDLLVACRLLLRGLTAGFGLGFHRAGVLLVDGEHLVGLWGEGPADEREAHRVWESLELEDVDVERTLDGAEGSIAGAFAERVRALRIAEADPWARRALELPAVALLEADACAPLAAVDLGPPVVVAPLRARSAALGLVFADDRWGGSISPERLRHTQLFVEQAALVLENLKLFERVLGLARTDPLTGLCNRREMDARLRLLVDRARRLERPLGLVVVDVDHFKRTNDTEGHAAGDELLRKVARTLERGVRAEDSSARFGGDEFVLLLPDLDAQALARLVARLGDDAASVGASVSIGAALLPNHATTAAALLAAADAALYRSKNAGRGCAHVESERIDYLARRTG
ncbi:MAG: GGDEF domain-containing protein [Polyangiaceae bacterium]